jgi:hypothetical protein
MHTPVKRNLVKRLSMPDLALCYVFILSEILKGSGIREELQEDAFEQTKVSGHVNTASSRNEMEASLG